MSRKRYIGLLALGLLVFALAIAAWLYHKPVVASPVTESGLEGEILYKGEAYVPCAFYSAERGRSLGLYSTGTFQERVKRNTVYAIKGDEEHRFIVVMGRQTAAFIRKADAAAFEAVTTDPANAETLEIGRQTLRPLDAALAAQLQALAPKLTYTYAQGVRTDTFSIYGRFPEYPYFRVKIGAVIRTEEATYYNTNDTVVTGELEQALLPLLTD